LPESPSRSEKTGSRAQERPARTLFEARKVHVLVREIAEDSVLVLAAQPLDELQPPPVAGRTGSR